MFRRDGNDGDKDGDKYSCLSGGNKVKKSSTNPFADVDGYESLFKVKKKEDSIFKDPSFGRKTDNPFSNNNNREGESTGLLFSSNNKRTSGFWDPIDLRKDKANNKLMDTEKGVDELSDLSFKNKQVQMEEGVKSLDHLNRSSFDFQAELKKTRKGQNTHHTRNNKNLANIPLNILRMNDYNKQRAYNQNKISHFAFEDYKAKTEQQVEASELMSISSINNPKTEYKNAKNKIVNSIRFGDDLKGLPSNILRLNDYKMLNSVCPDDDSNSGIKKEFDQYLNVRLKSKGKRMFYHKDDHLFESNEGSDVQSSEFKKSKVIKKKQMKLEKSSMLLFKNLSKEKSVITNPHTDRPVPVQLKRFSYNKQLGGTGFEEKEESKIDSGFNKNLNQLMQRMNMGKEEEEHKEFYTQPDLNYNLNTNMSNTGFGTQSLIFEDNPIKPVILNNYGPTKEVSNFVLNPVSKIKEFCNINLFSKKEAPKGQLNKDQSDQFHEDPEKNTMLFGKPFNDDTSSKFSMDDSFDHGTSYKDSRFEISSAISFNMDQGMDTYLTDQIEEEKAQLSDFGFNNKNSFSLGNLDRNSRIQQLRKQLDERVEEMHKEPKGGEGLYSRVTSYFKSK